MNRQIILDETNRDPTSLFSLINAYKDTGLPKDCALVVTGAQGSLGQTYLKVASEIVDNPHQLIGIHRRPLTGDEAALPESVTYLQADLSDCHEVEKAIPLVQGFRHMAVVHTVGAFKYEPDGCPEYDPDCDGIDDEIMKTNYITTQNLVRTVADWNKRTSQRVDCTLTMFGSLTEGHNFPYFKSYNSSLRKVREMLRAVTEEDPQFGVRFFNIPTLNTIKEHELRPYINPDECNYWLDPMCLAVNSWPTICEPITGSDRFHEISMYVYKPGFNIESFVTGHADGWRVATGISNSNSIEGSGRSKERY